VVAGVGWEVAALRVGAAGRGGGGPAAAGLLAVVRAGKHGSIDVAAAARPGEDGADGITAIASVPLPSPRRERRATIWEGAGCEKEELNCD